MQYFVLTIASAVSLFFLTSYPQPEAAVGFFFAIPLGLASLPFIFLPHSLAFALGSLWPPALAIYAHFKYSHEDNWFRDSPLSVFAVVWVVCSLRTLNFLCQFMHGGGSYTADACSGLFPDLP